MLTADKVREAIMKWPSRYETEGGRKFLGERVSAVPAALRDAGWKNVSHFSDRSELRALGLEIVSANYVNGARPTGRFVDVVVVKEV